MIDQVDDFYPRREFVERVECLIRGMGDDERPVRWVMETLPRTINDEDYNCDRELIAVSLSGVLRLKEAIPYLIALLHDERSRNGRACRSFPVQYRRGRRDRGARPMVCRCRTVFSVAGRDGPSAHPARTAAFARCKSGRGTPRTNRYSVVSGRLCSSSS